MAQNRYNESTTTFPIVGRSALLFRSSGSTVSENQRQEWASAVEKGKVRIQVAVFPLARLTRYGLQRLVLTGQQRDRRHRPTRPPPNRDPGNSEGYFAGC